MIGKVSYKPFCLALLATISNSPLLCSNRSIEVENDSNYQINITANTADLKLDHQVPANSKSKILIQVSSISGFENMLLNAIANNSVAQILNAINAGVNVNLTIFGKRPLEWAIFFNHRESIKCLVNYGATL